MIRRSLNLSKLHSFFLFGARGTGKSTLIHKHFENTKHELIDLLDPETFIKLQANPSFLESMLGSTTRENPWIIIDEVQKVPQLLDLVHLLIENKKFKFALTGSSARKLKRGGGNLLAGRAFTYKLYPLLESELGDKFDLIQALGFGTLPKILQFESRNECSLFLQSYVETYIQEEIISEQIIRNMPPFRRFLQVAAQTNGNIINFTKIASEASTDAGNVKNYFYVLEDTLIGFFLEPYHRSIRKRQRQSPKFYWFDTGVSRAVSKHLDLPVKESTYEYGKLFESFLITQIKTHLEYQQKQFQLSYLMTKDNAEVDLIIERAGEKNVFIEIKSSKDVREEELANLELLAKDDGAIPVCLYNGTRILNLNGVKVFPWRTGFKELGIS